MKVCATIATRLMVFSKKFSICLQRLLVTNLKFNHGILVMVCYRSATQKHGHQLRLAVRKLGITCSACRVAHTCCGCIAGEGGFASDCANVFFSIPFHMEGKYPYPCSSTTILLLEPHHQQIQRHPASSISRTHYGSSNRNHRRSAHRRELIRAYP
jgi:hypothetical protein